MTELVHIKNVTEFSKHINGDKLCVIDFYATWCGPCKMIAPEFESMSYSYQNATFLKVDVDNCKEISAACGIKAMPTFQLYKSGEKLAEVVGADLNTLNQKIILFGGSLSPFFEQLYEVFPTINSANFQLLNSILKNIVNHPDEEKFQTIKTKNQKVKNLVEDKGAWFVLQRCGFKKSEEEIKLVDKDSIYLMKKMIEDLTTHKAMVDSPVIFDSDDDTNPLSNCSNFGIEMNGRSYDSVKKYLDDDGMDSYFAVKSKFFHSKFCMTALVRTGNRKIICEGDKTLGPLLEKIRNEILS